MGQTMAVIDPTDATTPAPNGGDRRFAIATKEFLAGEGKDKGKPPPEREWNILCDPRAARAVFTSGVPLVVAPLDATATLKLEEPLRRKLFHAGTRPADQLQTLYRLWGQPTPTLYDPVAAFRVRVPCAGWV